MLLSTNKYKCNKYKYKYDKLIGSGQILANSSGDETELFMKIYTEFFEYVPLQSNGQTKQVIEQIYKLFLSLFTDYIVLYNLLVLTIHNFFRRIIFNKIDTMYNFNNYKLCYYLLYNLYEYIFIIMFSSSLQKQDHKDYLSYLMTKLSPATIQKYFKSILTQDILNKLLSYTLFNDPSNFKSFKFVKSLNKYTKKCIFYKDNGNNVELYFLYMSLKNIINDILISTNPEGLHTTFMRELKKYIALLLQKYYNNNKNLSTMISQLLGSLIHYIQQLNSTNITLNSILSDLINLNNKHYNHNYYQQSTRSMNFRLPPRVIIQSAGGMTINNISLFACPLCRGESYFSFQLMYEVSPTYSCPICFSQYSDIKKYGVVLVNHINDQTTPHSMCSKCAENIAINSMFERGHRNLRIENIKCCPISTRRLQEYNKQCEIPYTERCKKLYTSYITLVDKLYTHMTNLSFDEIMVDDKQFMNFLQEAHSHLKLIEEKWKSDTFTEEHISLCDEYRDTLNLIYFLLQLQQFVGLIPKEDITRFGSSLSDKLVSMVLTVDIFGEIFNKYQNNLDDNLSDTNLSDKVQLIKYKKTLYYYEDVENILNNFKERLEKKISDVKQHYNDLMNEYSLQKNNQFELRDTIIKSFEDISIEKLTDKEKMDMELYIKYRNAYQNSGIEFLTNDSSIVENQLNEHKMLETVKSHFPSLELTTDSVQKYIDHINNFVTNLYNQIFELILYSYNSLEFKKLYGQLMELCEQHNKICNMENEIDKEDDNIVDRDYKHKKNKLVKLIKNFLSDTHKKTEEQIPILLQNIIKSTSTLMRYNRLHEKLLFIDTTKLFKKTLAELLTEFHDKELIYYKSIILSISEIRDKYESIVTKDFLLNRLQDKFQAVTNINALNKHLIYIKFYNTILLLISQSEYIIIGLCKVYLTIIAALIKLINSSKSTIKLNISRLNVPDIESQNIDNIIKQLQEQIVAIRASTSDETTLLLTHKIKMLEDELAKLDIFKTKSSSSNITEMQIQTTEELLAKINNIFVIIENTDNAETDKLSITDTFYRSIEHHYDSIGKKNNQIFAQSKENINSMPSTNIFPNFITGDDIQSKTILKKLLKSPINLFKKKSVESFLYLARDKFSITSTLSNCVDTQKYTQLFEKTPDTIEYITTITTTLFYNSPNTELDMLGKFDTRFVF